LTATAGFVAALFVTLGFLGAAVATGLRAKRRWHLASVGGAVASLGVTIVFALEVGELYDLESAGLITPIHLTLARVTTVCYLLPAASGAWTIRDPRRRSLHRRLAYFVLAMTVVTAITGTWMLLAATPIADVVPADNGASGGRAGS
jgi:hypothetical protein